MALFITARMFLKSILVVAAETLFSRHSLKRDNQGLVISEKNRCFVYTFKITKV